jgi:hypothetical protein
MKAILTRHLSISRLILSFVVVLAVVGTASAKGSADDDAALDLAEPDFSVVFLLGLGGRARIASTVYVVGEVSPRVAGYAPGDTEYRFGIEKRAGAHVFQLTFANTFGTTLGQLARGGSPETLYLGFNLTRKFF